MKLAGLFKGKVLVAATPAGRGAVHAIMAMAHGQDALHRDKHHMAYAQFLVTHAKANEKLTDSDARSYLALALQHCGATPLETCPKTNVQPGHSGSKKGGKRHGRDHTSNI